MAVLAAALVAVSGCGKKPEAGAVAGAATNQGASQAKAPGQARGAQPSDKGGDAVQHKVLSFNLEGLNDKGAKKWDVKGESAEAVSENEVRLDNITAKAYGEEAQAVITADQGVYDKVKNNVRLQKNVKATIESTNGFNGGFAGVTGPGAQASGPSGAPSEKKADRKSTTIITCDGEVEFDYERNVAFFTKNVHVDSEDGSIVADRITVNLNPDTRQVKDIVAEGSVKIKRGDNMTYSEKAVYDAVTKKVTLAGRPKLIIYQEGSEGVDVNFMGDLGGKKK
jgi:hypothetical protein